jgi:hypothetical protein
MSFRLPMFRTRRYYAGGSLEQGQPTKPVLHAKPFCPFHAMAGDFAVNRIGAFC